LGCEELIDSLRLAAEEKGRLLWIKAEEEARAMRENASTEIARMKASLKMAASAEEQLSDILSAATKEARMIRMSAEKTLCARMLAIASCCLPSLIRETYKEDFGAFVRELPPVPWECVTVNPRDKSVAREYFSNAKILADENVAGGFTVSADDGRVRVINTFEKRLERGWTEMVPAVIKEVRNELSIEDSAAGS
jgi:V/A-type H+/Na+-transporting ATPase subunit E